MSFLLAILTGIIETDIPESVTQTSYVLVDLPSTLTLISSDALSFFNLEILTLFIISMSGLVGADGVEGDISVPLPPFFGLKNNSSRA